MSSRPAQDYDVVVVGARCAGAATAVLLARAGLSVLVVDRARYGSDTLSTHALTLPGVLQLSLWGLLDAVRAAGTPRIAAVIQHYGDERVAIPIRPRGPVDGLYAPRRHILDRILVDAAVAAGATVRHGVGMRKVVVRDGRAVGIVLDDDRLVRARLVLGADGTGSATARQVGARTHHRAGHSSATIYAFVDGLRNDAYTNYFRPGVGVGIIPTNAGQANVWVSVPMDRVRSRPRAAAVALYAETVSSVAGIDASRIRGPFRTFPGQVGFTRQLWGPGWALVGDAAYFKDPLSAHGMTDALIGAQVLADAVIAIANGTDETDALQTYAAIRHQMTAPMRHAVDSIASFGWDCATLKHDHLTMNAAMRAEWDFLTSLPDPTREAGEGRRGGETADPCGTATGAVAAAVQLGHGHGGDGVQDRDSAGVVHRAGELR